MLTTGYTMRVRIVISKVYYILKVAHCVQPGNPWTYLYDSQTILLITKFINVTVRTLYKQAMVLLLTIKDKTHQHRMPDTVAFCQRTQGRWSSGSQCQHLVIINKSPDLGPSVGSFYDLDLRTGRHGVRSEAADRAPAWTSFCAPPPAVSGSAPRAASPGYHQ